MYPLAIVGWRRAFWWIDQVAQDYELAEQREKLEELQIEFQGSLDDIECLRETLEDTINERRQPKRASNPIAGSLDEKILNELTALDPSIPHDAFLLEEAKFVGDKESDDYADHRNHWRKRVLSVASRYLNHEEFNIGWSTDGEMFVWLRE